MVVVRRRCRESNHDINNPVMFYTRVNFYDNGKAYYDKGTPHEAVMYTEARNTKKKKR